jgi:hypothetical protein
VFGLEQSTGYSKYHRVLNRAKWNGLALSQILLGLLIDRLPDAWPLVIIVDETLERRHGKKIKAKGYYRDGVRSSHAQVVKCYGLKWGCMALLVPLPSLLTDLGVAFYERISAV